MVNLNIQVVWEQEQPSDQDRPQPKAIYSILPNEIVETKASNNLQYNLTGAGGAIQGAVSGFADRVQKGDIIGGIIKGTIQ